MIYCIIVLPQLISHCAEIIWNKRPFIYFVHEVDNKLRHPIQKFPFLLDPLNKINANHIDGELTLSVLPLSQNNKCKRMDEKFVDNIMFSILST